MPGDSLDIASRVSKLTVTAQGLLACHTPERTALYAALPKFVLQAAAANFISRYRGSGLSFCRVSIFFFSLTRNSQSKGSTWSG